MPKPHTNDDRYHVILSNMLFISLYFLRLAVFFSLSQYQVEQCKEKKETPKHRSTCIYHPSAAEPHSNSKPHFLSVAPSQKLLSALHLPALLAGTKQDCDLPLAASCSGD